MLCRGATWRVYFRLETTFQAAERDAARRVSTNNFFLARDGGKQFRVQERLEFLVVGLEMYLQV